MSDTDLGDSFQRHRGAVLKALLSEPSLEVQAATHDKPPRVVASVGVRPEEFEVETSAPKAGRRHAVGPRASDQILALLNGGVSEIAPEVEFPPDYSERTASEPKSAPAEDPPSAGNGAGAAAEVVRNLSARVAFAWLRRPKIALVIGGGLVVSLVLLLTVTQGSHQSKPAAIETVTNSPTAAPSVPTTTTVVGAVIQVKSAQSHCPPGSTAGMDAFGGQGKAWSCVRAYKVDGQVLTIDLGKTYQLDSVGIVPGWDSVGSDGVDQWPKYRTVSRVSYRFDDPNATTDTQETLGQRTLVVTRLNPPITASHITLTVLESKGDPSTNVVAISSIVITGH
ncbi:discoidin domain-containing protein [Nocardia sp. CDC160]|uniref:discoidin domain-containing protein n=1 Tax=Nocardia sp. CDC160 TaxID=3112166 RepID=UPI002DBE9763|nr:discoidin domain-containing protein [Nocardia sp. CDC160]MEC3920223.1 discoidin domain-containing protein [Nocardia sp. CDC160]